jgi:spore germination protein PE
MLHRTAKVDFIKVDSAGTGSCVQIGDSSLLFSYTRAVALQREQEIFYSNEAGFDSYEIFSYSFPIPPLEEPILFQSTSINPIIKVGSVRISGLAAGAMIHVGNTKHIQKENRSMHIRQLENGKGSNDNRLKEE